MSWLSASTTGAEAEAGDDRQCLHRDARKEKVLKIPSAALRFKPKGEKETQEAKTKQAGTGPRKKRKEAGQKVFIAG